jgi:hypothetical protein
MSKADDIARSSGSLPIRLCAQAGGAIEIRPIAEDARHGDPDTLVDALEPIDPSATREWCSPEVRTR